MIRIDHFFPSLLREDSCLEKRGVALPKNAVLHILFQSKTYGESSARYKTFPVDVGGIQTHSHHQDKSHPETYVHM